MADDVFTFDVTTNAGVTPDGPTTTQLAMPTCIVRRIVVRVPPGPDGHLGFRLAAAGTQIIPVNVGQWIVAANEIMTWDIGNAIQSGAWELISYNSGVYNHTVEVRFEVDYPWLHQAGPVHQPLAIGVSA